MGIGQDMRYGSNGGFAQAEHHLRNAERSLERLNVATAPAEKARIMAEIRDSLGLAETAIDRASPPSPESRSFAE